MTVHRALFISLVVAACAASPSSYSLGDVVGHYHFKTGPDEREEFVLEADGRLAWKRFSNILMRERGVGRWAVSGNEVIVELPGFSSALRGTAGRLVLRRFRDHVYMVHHSELGWFDGHGPMEEFCFSRDGAPLVEPPGYKAGA